MENSARLLKAVQTATKTLASTGDFDALLRDVLEICVEAVRAYGGTVYLHDAEHGRLRFRHVLPIEVEQKLPTKDIADDFGLAGKAFQSRRTVNKSFEPKGVDEQSQFEQATGVAVRSVVCVPLMLADGDPIGVVQLINKKDGPFTPSDIAVLETVAAISAMASLNVRLSEENARASSLLGMGKVSHDIGNLAAIMHATLGSGDLAIDTLRKELKHVKATGLAKHYAEAVHEVFTDLHLSVDRIVGYSRLISDLTAGRELQPNIQPGSLAEAVHYAASFYEEEAENYHIDLLYKIQQDAPLCPHDPLYVFRIVQNLIGNAIKAIRETMPDNWREKKRIGHPFGEISVGYRYENGEHMIEVSDTGRGMSADTARRILRGNARSQWERARGSGWGTKIVLELAAAHGGRVEIDSKVGKGSTFRVVIPGE